MSIVKIALTGGIACGKTQVSNILSNFGIKVIDMDELSREIVLPNKPAINELKKIFSDDIVQEDSFLNREKMRNILFHNKNAKQIIESILHPKIITLMNEKIAKLSTKIVVVVVPLLIEKKLQYLFDKFIVVDCYENVQIKRLKDRDLLTQEEAKNILNQQVSRIERLEFAQKENTFLIKNNCDLDSLKKQTQSIFNLLTT